MNYGNPPETKNELDRYKKFEKRHWIGNYEWKIIVIYDIQPNLS